MIGKRGRVSLGLRLVCLSASLTIMVSCFLEAPVPRQHCFLLPIHPLSSPYVSPPTVAGAAGIAYPLPLRNSFRFLCNKLKKFQHYCNVLFLLSIK